MIIPRMDGPWVPFEDQASIYTVVFYLNENFEGGETKIFPHSEMGLRFSFNCRGMPPKTGKIIVFVMQVHQLPRGSNTSFELR